MAQSAASYPRSTRPALALRPAIQWVRAVYQAPFQTSVTSENVRELERFRRATLLRVIAFTITLFSLCVTFPATLLSHAGPAAISALLLIILAGLLTLGCNARGWITLASGIYLYSFFLATYLYIILAPSDQALLVIAAYGSFNATLFLGGLTFSQQAVWTNCGLVIGISSLLLMLHPPDQAPVLGAPAGTLVLLVFLDASYLLTAFLCWLAGRSGRVNMIRIATILEQEQQLVALKDLFIVSANHELRTPIMTLSNNLELVARTLDRVDAHERQQMLERALRASRDLKGLLSNVLDAGVSETEIARQLHLESCSVRSVVQQALDTFDPRELGEPWLEQTTLKTRPVTLAVAPDLLIRADSGRVRQVLVNLLSNVLKYSDPTTPIEITAEAMQSDGKHAQEKTRLPAGRWVRINIRDWGLGVPPKEQRLLFQRFVRLARDAASSTRGTGVGLYLCRVLIQAMGGQIWVESTGIAGQGSVFAFVLPAAQHDAS